MLNDVVDFLTNPIVVLCLLPIISLFFTSSLFSPKFGFGGYIGSILLILFFYAHIVGDYATLNTVLLFLVGAGLLVLEIIVPGMILGFLGLIAIIGSILYSGANFELTAYALAIALFVAIIGMVVMVKLFGKKMSVFNRMVLSDSTDTESGYVSNVNRTELLNQKAVTVTPLRPSGVAMYNGERLDVVSEGSFIDNNQEVVIIKVEGSRIVVREKKEE